MSYHEVEPKSREGRIGKAVYLAALAGRRGFRWDQLMIEDPEIWEEIFEDMGGRALAAVEGEQ